MCHGRGYHKRWKHHHRSKREKFLRYHGWVKYPPVNIHEFDDHYELFVYAAGFKKEDIAANVKDNTLIISAKKGENDLVEMPEWVDKRREELDLSGFKRVFELNEKIDKDKITAEYKEGVLKVTLPKKEGSETYRQDLEIV